MLPTVGSSCLDVSGEIMMEQCFGALSDLVKGWDFGLKELSIAGEILYKRVSGGVPNFGRIKFHQGRQKTNGNNPQGYIKREPVNDIKGRKPDKCHNCGNWLKPNHRENCPAKNITCNNFSGKGNLQSIAGRLW